jgi:hypothetical protein
LIMVQDVLLVVFLQETENFLLAHFSSLLLVQPSLTLPPSRGGEG